MRSKSVVWFAPSSAISLDASVTDRRLGVRSTVVAPRQNDAAPASTSAERGKAAAGVTAPRTALPGTRHRGQQAGIVESVTRVHALFDALEVQVGVGQRVHVEQLPRASRCSGWTVRQVLEHSIGVTRKFTEFASGATDEPHAPPGDLIGSDHRVAVRDAADGARAAWGTADMTRSCRLGFGTFPADIAAGINLFDVLAHTWDIATAVGVDLDEDHDLWLIGLDAAQDVIGADRDRGHYDPEVPVPGTAPPMARFLAFLGRAARDRL